MEQMISGEERDFTASGAGLPQVIKKFSLNEVNSEH